MSPRPRARRPPGDEDPPALHVLILSTYYEPDVSANGALMASLAGRLREAGHTVTVVTSKPHFAPPDDAPAFRGVPWHRETGPGGSVYRLSVLRGPGENVRYDRLASYLSYSTLSPLAAARVPPPDVLFVPSPPITNGLLGDLLSRLRGVPFVYNVQDLMPDCFIQEEGGLEAGSLLAKVGYGIEGYVYRRAERVAVISRGFRDALLDKGVSPGKIDVIPNFVDTGFIRPVPKDNPFARSQGLVDRPVALFAGNLGKAQCLPNLVDAAERLDGRSDVLFLFVGEGQAKKALVEEVESRRLSNVRILPFQDREVLPDLYGTADVGLVSRCEGPSRTSVPSKVYSLMASGTAILASVARGSDTWRTVGRADAGRTVEPGDAGALASCLLELLEDPGERERLGANGRAHVREHNTPAVAAASYERTFRRAASGAGSPGGESDQRLFQTRT